MDLWAWHCFRCKSDSTARSFSFTTTLLFVTMSDPRLEIFIKSGCTLPDACKGLAVFFRNNSDLQTPCAACNCIKTLDLHDVRYRAIIERAF